MEMRQLKYFMAVAKAESYSAAAAELAVAQPTLSIAVRNLEQELGVQLFYTFGRRQRLTDEGQRLLEGAQRMMEEYRRTVEEVQNTGDTAAGTLTVGLPPLLGTCYFAALIPEFARKYPNVRIQVVEQGSYVIDQMIVDGELDIALTLNTEQVEQFESLPFTCQRVGVIVNRNNPLSERASLSFADLKGQRFAIFNQDFALHWQTVRACRNAGFAPQIVLLSSQWDFLVEVAAQNRAITILPKPIYDKYPVTAVRWVPLSDGPRVWDVRVARNKKRYMSNACKAFLRHIEDRRPPDDLL
ncbi:LysR substrate-binding domain-containing protein [Dysosmobacter sp.]|jgi:DNA-binding transcriptional LysR family regulator|uniref:LysR substrate-binding domain-containing protein n=1 Tax=Dysosmobacter sp. TaxID=2591382 RepID=UPI001BB479F4|nr:LysR substrate-binding domain-containing protein [Dysosmobacter sp.]MCI6055710.1 LysR substrate-binding domain-containing protein [Dysosmobacter sp.]MDY5510349.1 LysR substrate-binding domain-containing protein [Dysosmobacter sp.]QUO36608.1 LysR family transcriptional regulator [Dysosmobacter sp. Marseille-Q4140]